MKDRLTQVLLLAACLGYLAGVASGQSRLSERGKATAGIVCGPGNLHYDLVGDTGLADITPPAHGISLSVVADSVTIFFADGSTALAFQVDDSWSFTGAVGGAPNIVGFEIDGVAGPLKQVDVDWHSF